MPDQTSGFTVTDRRKFTVEGDLREGASVAEATPAAQSEPEPEPKLEPKLGPQLVQNEPPIEKEVVNRNLEPLPAEDESLDDEALAPEPTAAESAQQDADYRASSKKLDDMISQANPAARDTLGGRAAEMNFDKLVQSLYMTAALQMGAGTQPGEQPRVDILGARQSIDMLSVLVEKTKGNLNEKEQRLLQNALFELRMMFMEITNAISTSAHNPAAKPPIR
ncbi:MAG: hypothetical protein QOK38_1571 [Acidobacteriaceae bacterium]|jgi:hypothetical protein|nr:hypothetical protein [Acidobacteriaceae bacterium]